MEKYLSIFITNYLPLLITISVFVIITAASNELSKIFKKFKLPLITGFIVIGAITGPYVLKMIPLGYIKELDFVNDISLSFIAFAAGTELFLKELRGRMKNIIIMTISQLFVTFILSTVVLLIVADFIPFMSGLSLSVKIAIAILISTIFVARSPASAIAIINELRAKGPFTKTAISVTVLKDILVIILFTICFAVSDMLISETKINASKFIILFLELIVSIALGWVVAKLIELLLSLKIHFILKVITLILIGWGIYAFADLVKVMSHKYLSFHFYIEPLLTGIIATFLLLIILLTELICNEL